MFEVIEDTLIDGVKLVPFLFITYLFMEILEHKMNNNLKEKIAKAGKTGPVWGGILGVIPQCGFSTAAASLYSGGIITVGTLIAVFMSTSDEMLPILISREVSVTTILRILGTKVVIAVISGLVAEYFYIKIFMKLCDMNDSFLKRSTDNEVSLFPYVSGSRCIRCNGCWLWQ